MKYGRVVVFQGKRKAFRVFDTKGEALEFFEMAQDRFGDFSVFLVKYKHTPRPQNLSPKLTWCPYCGAIRNFKLDSYVGVKRCQICGISQDDFYVQYYNWYFFNVLGSVKKLSDKAIKRAARKRKAKEASGVTVELERKREKRRERRKARRERGRKG